MPRGGSDRSPIAEASLLLSSARAREMTWAARPQMDRLMRIATSVVGTGDRPELTAAVAVAELMALTVTSRRNRGAKILKRKAWTLFMFEGPLPVLN